MAFINNTPLDPSLYGMDPTALEFFKQQTGITGDDELKQHILAVQAKAFAASKLFSKEGLVLRDLFNRWCLTLVSTTSISQGKACLWHLRFYG